VPGPGTYVSNVFQIPISSNSKCGGIGNRPKKFYGRAYIGSFYENHSVTKDFPPMNKYNFDTDLTAITAYRINESRQSTSATRGGSRGGRRRSIRTPATTEGRNIMSSKLVSNTFDGSSNKMD